jgi:hypothetical protein
MLKTHMAACLLASALVAVPALAQTTSAPPADRPTATGSGSATSGSPAMQPGGAAGGTGMTGGTAGGSNMTGAGAGPTAPGTASGASSMGAGSGTATSSAGSGMAASSGAAASLKPLASPQPGQVMASDLRGTRVYSSNNESIGDISDLLLDRQGQVVAAIVGVGGFLGIGQKDVAVPFQALEIVPEGASSGSGAAGGPAATGTTGTAGGGSSAGAGGSGTMNPERVVLRNMTRADLESAPSFRSDGQASGGGTGSGSTPRQ